MNKLISAILIILIAATCSIKASESISPQLRKFWTTEYLSQVYGTEFSQAKRRAKAEIDALSEDEFKSLLYSHNPQRFAEFGLPELKFVPFEKIESISSMGIALEWTETIKKNYYASAKANPKSFGGPIKGLISKYFNQGVLDIMNSPEVTGFDACVVLIRGHLKPVFFGTYSLSEKQYDEFEGILPSSTDSPIQFENKLKVIREKLKSELRRQMILLESEGYYVAKLKKDIELDIQKSDQLNSN